MDRTAGLVSAFRRQGEACGALGSPIYRTLCGAAADDLERGGPVAAVMAAWDGLGDPMQLALPLRVLGTGHRLALLGEAPDLAGHLPSCEGSPGAGLAEAFLALVADRSTEFRNDLARPVQTNEVGRAAVLRAGLGALVAGADRPVRLLEMGAAAGLNLRLEHFSYRLGDTVLAGDGPHLEPDWTGPSPSMAPLTVVERRGCDRFPIDVTTREGAARAESFVWPDMLWRFRRMAEAVDVAAGVPVDIDEQPAGEWLVEHLVPATGTVTVLMHSVMWQYVSPEEQASIEELLVERGGAPPPTPPWRTCASSPCSSPTARGASSSVSRPGRVVTSGCWAGRTPTANGSDGTERRPTYAGTAALD